MLQSLVHSFTYLRSVVQRCIIRLYTAASSARGSKACGGVHLVYNWSGHRSMLRPGIDGARVEKVLDISSITLNKNSVPGDKSALVPGGIRIGTPAMTTRGLKEKDFELVADFIHEGIQISLQAKACVKGTKLKDFMDFVESPEFSLKDHVSELKSKVEALTNQFPMPGV